jgi:hypothetical protein
MNQQASNIKVSLPRRQMKRITPCVIGNVVGSVVVQQNMYCFSVAV